MPRACVAGMSRYRRCRAQLVTTVSRNHAISAAYDLRMACRIALRATCNPRHALSHTIADARATKPCEVGPVCRTNNVGAIVGSNEYSHLTTERLCARSGRSKPHRGTHTHAPTQIRPRATEETPNPMPQSIDAMTSESSWPPTDSHGSCTSPSQDGISPDACERGSQPNSETVEARCCLIRCRAQRRGRHRVGRCRH